MPAVARHDAHNLTGDRPVKGPRRKLRRGGNRIERVGPLAGRANLRSGLLPRRPIAFSSDWRAVDLTIAVDIGDQDINYATFGVASRTAPGGTFENGGASPSAIVGCAKAASSRFFSGWGMRRSIYELWTASKQNRYRSCFSSIAFT
jgi:hypothetical protein